MAEKARQNHRIHSTRFKAANHVENIQLAAILRGRAFAWSIAFGERMLLEDKFGLLCRALGGYCFDQLEKNVGSTQGTQATNDAIAKLVTSAVHALSPIT